jgi:hypothetical protein
MAISIKHNKETPPVNKLKEYQLGFDKDNNILCIGIKKDSSIEAFPLLYGELVKDK